MILSLVLAFAVSQPVSTPCGRTKTQPCFVKFSDGDTCTYDNNGMNVTCHKTTPNAAFGGFGIYKATGVSDLPDEPLVRNPVYVTADSEPIAPLLQVQLWHCEDKTLALEAELALRRSNGNVARTVFAFMVPVALLISFLWVLVGALQQLDKIAFALRRAEIPWKKSFDAVFFVALVLWIVTAVKGLFS